jgi:hypothetical protein
LSLRRARLWRPQLAASQARASIWRRQPAGRCRSSGRHLAKQRADRDRLAGVGRDLAQNARARRIDLERHFVRFQFNQRLIGADGIAGLLEPFADGRFGDRLAERRNTNLNRHFDRAARRPSCR